MCGIVGALVSPESDFRISGDYLVRMRDTMVHRGPDGAGVWVGNDGRIGLAHRRLAIIDLSDAAAQPMFNEDGQLAVVFNGEIYNHAEIRRELEALGSHVWKSDHSDTEVILHAFEQWGIDCVHRFRGMFAIALWDNRTRELWLVRDRIGIKPLYYSCHHGRTVFASEIKALLADPAQPRAVNEKGVYHYLSFLTTPAPETLFAGIQKLAPGTWLRITHDGRVTEHKYWDVWDHAEHRPASHPQEIAAQVLDTLRDAVRLRKVSDVPVGVFLSGGLDSSTNAVLFSEGETRRVKTFSIGYDDQYSSYPSELPYARQVASLVGAEHHERILGIEDLLAFVPRMVQLQDEPIGDPVCVPVYYVAELARQNGVIVCQLGEGSDELFFGYPAWQTKLTLQHFDDWPVPRAVKRWGLAGLSALGKTTGHPYEALRRGSLGQPVFWGGADSFTDRYKRKILSPRLNRELGDLTSWDALQPIWNRFKDRAWDTSPMNWMSYLDLNLRLPELLLMRVDKMSMGVSLEGRVPFLDHRLVELAMSIPPELKTADGELKAVLKNAVQGLLPPPIVRRRKQGFGVPLQEWFHGRLGPWARQQISEFCRETDYFAPAEVDNLIASNQTGYIWYLLNFALWWKEYIAQTGTGEPLNVRSSAA